MTELFTRPLVEDERPTIDFGMWIRRALMVLFAVWALLALADRFGQKQSTTTAAGRAATVSVRAPKTVRGGLFFETVVTVQVHQDITSPRILLGDGWFEGLQFNSLEPQPASESSRDG